MNKILVISLSNIGDVILTFPVIDVLKEKFPAEQLSVVVGPRAEALLKGNPAIHKLYTFEKNTSVIEKIKWVRALAREQFHLVVDLRNTAIPFFLSPKFRTPFFRDKSGPEHRKFRHLECLRTVFPFHSEAKHRYALYITGEDKRHVEGLIKENTLGEKFIVIGPGAANHTKQWKADGFAALSDALIEKHKKKIVFVGDQSDAEVAAEVKKKMKNPVINLCGKTTLLQLAELMRHSSVVVANDSAIMHLASYLDVPTAAIFGPTDPKKYGPWSTKNVIIKRDLFCSPCEKSGCAYNHECMGYIHPEAVLKEVSGILS